MPSQRNIQQLEALKDKLSRAKSIVLSDHSGMDVSSQQKLRTLAKEAGGEFLVTKNTLLGLALGQSTNTFDGPTSVLCSYQDELSPLKILVKFSEEHEKPIIKAGFLGKMPLSVDEIRQLSSLPGFSELVAQLVGTLQGPMYGLRNVLAGNMKKLILVLNAIKKDQ